jgi:hypothetical protein
LLLNRAREEAGKLDYALSGRGPRYTAPGRPDWFLDHVCNIGSFGPLPPADQGDALLNRMLEIIKRESERLAELDREIERLTPIRTF